MLSLSKSPQPTCVFLPSPSHHELNFSLCPRPHILHPLLCPAMISNAMTSSTRTTRFLAMTPSTSASRSPFTLRCKHPFPRAPLSSNNRKQPLIPSTLSNGTGTDFPSQPSHKLQWRAAIYPPPVQHGSSTINPAFMFHVPQPKPWSINFPPERIASDPLTCFFIQSTKINPKT